VIEPVQKFTDQLRNDAPELFSHEPCTNDTTPSDPPLSLAPTTTTTATTINHPLESWHPTPTPTYDLIWNQWCLGHLTDEQLTAYLSRLIPSLRPNGWIVVKENVLGDGKRTFPLTTTSAADTTTTTSPSSSDPTPSFAEADLYDAEDSSVTRSAGKFEWIFGRAGLRVVRTEVQRGFGRELGLFPVRMWGLQPIKSEEGVGREEAREE
jgi:protein N-terminal methyltransferase